jgi:hypothetical protein
MGFEEGVSQVSRILDILADNRWRLMQKANVVGVGKGLKMVKGVRTEQSSITVLVKEKVTLSSLKSSDIIPEEINGIPTDVFEVGELRLLSSIRTEKRRPAQPGVGIGHYKVTAGTFGALVKDIATGQTLILSNNHVLANISNGKDGRARVGDSILQPGSYDGGKPDSDVIGTLERFVPLVRNSKEADCQVASLVAGILNDILSIVYPAYTLKFVKSLKAENTVDCAVAKPVSSDMVRKDILEIGQVNGIAEVGEKTRVKKSGRTTGLTRGEVVATNATVSVKLSDSENGIFMDQIVATSISQGGDSGSLVLDENNAAVGLLFAGSDKATIFNRIQNVLSELRVELL